MSLENWRSYGWVSAQQPSPEEIRDLLAVAARDLKDCQSKDISADWRFNIAYNAILQAATAALAAAGYRAGRNSHHYRVLQSLALTVGLDESTLRQLDEFRKKRNMTGYERVGAVSDGELQEIIQAARTVRQLVEDWIRKNHRELL